ncbi:DUF488 family protein [Roseovarius dicentrarchi]|uniref:DUF488 domain-containing protein n=1 Tax=Roseovarius dicentrarchi TaxID=2250573 RepID=UPI000DE9D24F|nr:DUF488 domain-containing protein [Roseovarius dicentrarchi]
MTGGFYTVGHSNRSLEEFMDILQHAGVQMVVDVRSFPRSRTNPVFNTDTLPGDLAGRQIGYCHMPALGGRRKQQPEVADCVNALWRNQSFQNYADYALSDKFAEAFAELVRLGSARRVALMCSEAVWWRCHRRIITDYLLLNGHEVTHLMGNRREDAATPTPGATRAADETVHYPAPA